MRRYLTALRPVYVPFREAEPDQLHDAWCPATAAKRHPEGQRDDGLTRDGRVTARRERIFPSGNTLVHWSARGMVSCALRALRG